MKNDTIKNLIWTVSAFVFIVVILLNRKVITNNFETPKWIYILPFINAIINTLCTILLLVSFYFIKNKKIEKHKQLNIITFLLSAVFLVLYIAYHYFAPETKFGGQGIIRPVYYFLLITHIVCSIIVFPLILWSFTHGLQMQVEKHKKVVRFAFPMWLYVTITGVLVYIIIQPYYPNL